MDPKKFPRASARRLEKSIAVLPFDNFSADEENAYFAVGIQDDLLTNLASVHGPQGCGYNGDYPPQ